jgi:hypothetical protein
VAEGKKQYRKENAPPRPHTGGIEGFEQIKPEITLLQVPRTGTGEDYHEPLEEGMGSFHRRGRGEGQDPGSDERKGPSEKEEEGKGEKEGDKIPSSGFCKTPGAETFGPPYQIGQERQGGQDIGEDTEKLPVCRKGQGTGTYPPGGDAGKKENKINDQGLDEGIRDFLLLTGFPSRNIVLYNGQ